MISTCACPHCEQKIEFEAENAESIVSCPNCGKEITLKAPTPPAFVVAVATAGRTVREYLAKLREESCYRELRSLINVIFFFGIVATVLADVGWYFTRVENGVPVSALILAIVCGTLLSLALLIAGRQAAFVLIDIADALIHEGNSTFKKP